MAAASARLCVETKEHRDCVSRFDAAASARLCVETIALVCEILKPSAAASARLCVETPISLIFPINSPGSRLRAAVC